MNDKLPTYGVNSPTSTPTRPEYTVAAPTVDDDAVERAARAIFAELDGREDWETWDVLPEEWKDGHRRKARAALAAAGTSAGRYEQVKAVSKAIAKVMDEHHAPEIPMPVHDMATAAIDALASAFGAEPRQEEGR